MRRSCPEAAVRAHVHQQGLRRRPQPDHAGGTADPLGLRRPGVRRRHPRDVLHRPVQALAVRRVQGGRRRHGAGVRPLLRHADLLPARRLPDRARTTPAWSSTASSATSSRCNVERPRTTASSATRASRSATTSTRTTWRGSSEAFIESPRAGEVYNIGGGRGNSCSILEAFARVDDADRQGDELRSTSTENREGDHICYISDLRKMTQHYPTWGITRTLDDIFEELVTAWMQRG